MFVAEHRLKYHNLHFLPELFFVNVSQFERSLNKSLHIMCPIMSQMQLCEYAVPLNLQELRYFLITDNVLVFFRNCGCTSFEKASLLHVSIFGGRRDALCPRKLMCRPCSGLKLMRPSELQLQNGTAHEL